jgi:CRISPR type I-D-associated protein Csc2
VSTRRGTQELNFRHRIEYSSAYSLLPYDEIEESITFNAIDEITTRVGQALGETPTVAPANIFPSIVTLNTVTWKEFLLALKTVLATRSYGGETRTRGDVSNIILGIAAGWEEIVSPLELTLELYDGFDTNKSIDEKQIAEILGIYQKKAAFVKRTKVLSPEEVFKILAMVQEYDLTKEFLDEAYEDVDEFLAKASSLEKGQTVEETSVATRRKTR